MSKTKIWQWSVDSLVGIPRSLICQLIVLPLFSQHFPIIDGCAAALTGPPDHCRIGLSLESTTYCVINDRTSHSPSSIPFVPFEGGRPMEGGTAEIGLMESRVATDWAHRIPHGRSCCRGRSKPSRNGTKEKCSVEPTTSRRLREYIPRILLAMGEEDTSFYWMCWPGAGDDVNRIVETESETWS